MIKKAPWLERIFPTGIPLSMFPGLLERLRGTPARLEERLVGTAPALLTRRPEGTWSIQENAGHLAQTEELWFGRLDDFQAGRAELRPARFEVGRVEASGFNEMPLARILETFRAHRLALVMRLELLDEAVLRHEARHPRLDQAMRVTDLMLFAAEHDDHHLARVGEILRVGD